jgi:hypothetical protein
MFGSQPEVGDRWPIRILVQFDLRRLPIEVHSSDDRICSVLIKRAQEVRERRRRLYQGMSPQLEGIMGMAGTPDRRHVVEIVRVP